MAQTGSAQEEPSTVGWLTERNAEYERRFRKLLLSDHDRDLSVGWALARDLGRPAVPLLWNMLRAEGANVDRRLALLVAAMLAGGPGEDERLFRFLDEPRPMLQERAMASMMLALGPRRARPIERTWARLIGPNDQPEPLLGLAARLACSRFPRSVDGVPTLIDDDPGMLAAAAFSGLPTSRVARSRWWRSDDRHADLFRRGALLGEGARLTNDGVQPGLLPEATAALAGSDVRREDVRAAAILLLARAGKLDANAPRPDWPQLQLVASQGASLDVLRAWLPATPLPRDDAPERLAAAFGTWQPFDRVVATRDEWSAHPDSARHLAVAFAARLLRAAPTRRVPFDLPEVPEWRFAVWASGGDFGAPTTIADPRLAQLARVVVAGRVTREVARRTLEDALWRWGSHPGIGPWREERRLVRDLLLSGSNRGGGKYMPHIRADRRYFPTGLDRNDGFFTVAVALYEFSSQPTLPMPQEYRLP